MDTYFASPCRSNASQLHHQSKIVASNPVIDGVMRVVGGLVAVLNENRQVITVNEQLLNTLGVDNPDKVFGLRPGEAIGCSYATEMPAGCGTSEYCMTCGAAIAIATSLGKDWPVDRNCAISAERDGQQVDLFFRVHAAPIKIEAERFVLLFLHDISRQQRLAVLDRVFVHDINDTITGLKNAAELLCACTNGEALDAAKKIAGLTKRLAREVELQGHLSQYQNISIDPTIEVIPVEWIINELEQLMNNHPAMHQKNLQIQNSASGLLLHTDPALILRVLSNMLLNAFEAAANCRTVRFRVATRYGQVVFSVWNAEVISPSIASRIFQRNFSTKEELGRGLGTFLMKLIGEQLLGGRVYFESSTTNGTIFFLELPI
jgi:K+-sensing histidine kinase KdpD